MNPTSASSFRRTACGLCLIVGPLLLLLASILDPSEGGDDDKKYLQSLKDDPDMVQLSTALWIWGFALAVIGLIGVVHVIRERGVTLANIGGALAIMGGIFFVALVTTTVNELIQVEHLDIDTAVELSNDIEDYWVAYVVLIPALLGTLIGFLLLGVSLIRSRLTHIAAPILIIVGTLMLPFSDGSGPVGIVANVLLFAGWGIVGLRLLGLSNEQWEGRASIATEPAAPGPAGGPPAGGPPPPPAAPPPAV
jgi:hypothetical protein